MAAIDEAVHETYVSQPQPVRDVGPPAAHRSVTWGGGLSGVVGRLEPAGAFSRWLDDQFESGQSPVDWMMAWQDCNSFGVRPVDWPA